MNRAARVLAWWRDPRQWPALALVVVLLLALPPLRALLREVVGGGLNRNAWSRDHSDDARPTSDRIRMGAQSRRGAKGANYSGSRFTKRVMPSLIRGAPKFISRPSRRSASFT